MGLALVPIAKMTMSHSKMNSEPGISIGRRRPEASGSPNSMRTQLAAIPGVATARQLQGKELSYNNINDTDAAYECIAEFDPARTAACVIVKHANPCGVAEGADLDDSAITGVDGESVALEADPGVTAEVQDVGAIASLGPPPAPAVPPAAPPIPPAPDAT